MNQFSRHRNNIVGQTLCERVRASVMKELIAARGPGKLLPVSQFLALPTAWGPPEFRLSFLYAKETGQREIRFTEYAGANFFSWSFNLNDDIRLEHYVPVTLTTEQQEIVRQAIHKYFLTGSYVVHGYEALFMTGTDLYHAWMNNTQVNEAQAA
jgi:hypothetical protein